PRPIELFSRDRGPQTLRTNVDVEAAEEHLLDVEKVEQLLEPVEQQVLAIASGDLDRALLRRRDGGGVFHDGGEERPGRLGEERVEVGRLDAQSQIGGVVEVLEHARHATTPCLGMVAETRPEEKGSPDSHRVAVNVPRSGAASV